MENPTSTSTRGECRALLIGINRYPNFSDHGQLAGCVNDVEAMAGLLTTRFSFAGENVERLIDAAASQAGIRAAVERLIERTGSGDLVVIHYSGHGSRIASRTSPDGKDETIVPADSGRNSFDNRDIPDVEIHQWLLRLSERSRHLTLIFDSCHSGHILRDPFGAKGRWVDEDPRPAEQLPPLPTAVQRALGKSREAGPGSAAGYRQPLGSRYVMLAGCRSAETSFEILAEDTGGVQHGAFTYYLCQELAKAGPRSSFRDLFEVAAPRVSSMYPS